MKLNEFFERVIVINLDSGVDRKMRLQLHVDEVSIMDSKQLEWSRAICGISAPPPPWWQAGTGAWGCLMSHLRIAQDAIHDKVTSYCVLEDDVVFHPRASEMFSQFIKSLPSDWGQVYLGGQFLHRQPEVVNPWVVRPFNVNRTHAFGLHHDVIPSFVQHIMHFPDYINVNINPTGEPNLLHNHFHIDHQLGRAHENMNWTTYAPSWWIAGQEGGASQISCQNNVRLWWHWKNNGAQLPFVFLPNSPSHTQRTEASQFLHTGYNLSRDRLIDTGIKSPLDDAALLHWMNLIAGEAIERWLLPGFEVPDEYPHLHRQAMNVWQGGVVAFDPILIRSLANYPHNGLCGGLPGFY
jgi:hypothetical protein